MGYSLYPETFTLTIFQAVMIGMILRLHSMWLVAAHTITLPLCNLLHALVCVCVCVPEPAFTRSEPLAVEVERWHVFSLAH